MPSLAILPPVPACACVRALPAGEVEAARRVAERALAAIDPAQQDARFNVWVAALNLEDAYGGEAAESSLMGMFNRCGVNVCVCVFVAGMDGRLAVFWSAGRRWTHSSLPTCSTTTNQATTQKQTTRTTPTQGAGCL